MRVGGSLSGRCVARASCVAFAAMTASGGWGVDAAKPLRNPEEVARALLRAIYSNDHSALDAVIVPHRGSDQLLGREKLSPEKLREVDAEVAKVHFQRLEPFRCAGKDVTVGADGDYPIGTMVRYNAAFRGTPMMISVVRRPDGWRVDLRWWMAMMKEATGGGIRRGSPEAVVKEYLAALLTGDRETVRRLALPGASASVLFADLPPTPEPSDVLASMALEMPVIEAEKGEAFRLPSGEVARATGGGNEKVLVGLFGPLEVVFRLQRARGQWSVAPQAYYRVLNR